MLPAPTHWYEAWKTATIVETGIGPIDNLDG